MKSPGNMLNIEIGIGWVLQDAVYESLKFAETKGLNTVKPITNI